MSSKHSRQVVPSRPKFTAPPVDDDSDYEGEPSKSFPPIVPIKTTNGEDDGIAEEENNIIHNRRGKYKFDELFNKLNIKTPLPHAANTYSRVLEYNIRKFRYPLESIAKKINSSTSFYITIKIGDIEGMPSGAAHRDYETFIQLLGFHGYRITRKDKSDIYDSETQINVICIPGDK